MRARLKQLIGQVFWNTLHLQIIALELTALHKYFLPCFKLTAAAPLLVGGDLHDSWDLDRKLN